MPNGIFFYFIKADSPGSIEISSFTTAKVFLEGPSFCIFFISYKRYFPESEATSNCSGAVIDCKVLPKNNL
jgi:hypothetical protein